MKHDTNYAESFTALVKRHEKIIFSVCFFYASSEVPFEDLRQEVLISLFNSFRNFKRQCAESTWVYRVCLNTCMFSLRKLTSKIKILQRPGLHYYGPLILLSFPVYRLIDNRTVGSFAVEYPGAILRAYIVTLAIQYRRVNSLEVQIDKKRQGHNVRIIDNLYSLCRSGFSAAHLVIRWRHHQAICVSGLSSRYTAHLRKEMLRTPEASSGKVYFLHILVI